MAGKGAEFLKLHDRAALEVRIHHWLRALQQF